MHAYHVWHCETLSHTRSMVYGHCFARSNDRLLWQGLETVQMEVLESYGGVSFDALFVDSRGKSMSSASVGRSIVAGQERAMGDVVAQRRRRDAWRCGAVVSVQQIERAL